MTSQVSTENTIYYYNKWINMQMMPLLVLEKINKINQLHKYLDDITQEYNLIIEKIKIFEEEYTKQHNISQNPLPLTSTNDTLPIEDSDGLLITICKLTTKKDTLYKQITIIQNVLLNDKITIDKIYYGLSKLIIYLNNSSKNDEHSIINNIIQILIFYINEFINIIKIQYTDKSNNQVSLIIHNLIHISEIELPYLKYLNNSHNNTIQLKDPINIYILNIRLIIEQIYN